VELEDRVGAHAGGGGGDFIDRDDDLRVDAVIVIDGVQGVAAALEGVRTGRSSRDR
jgi:hypothetical protein